MSEDASGPLPHPDGRRELRADCGRCVGLCCVAPAFTASADFAIDKPAGRPCHHLQPDFRCGIHGSLRERGFPGCTAYDCFGAGQQVAQVTFTGQDWRRTPQIAERMFSAFTIMRQLHELLWYLHEASTLPAARPLAAEIGRALAETERCTRLSHDDLGRMDVAAHRRDAGDLLRRAGALARAGARGVDRRGVDHRGADLIGTDLRRTDLRGADLSGAYLIGADLRGVDLRAADLLGADLRGADLGGAELAGSVFLTQMQVAAARGDRATTLPALLTRPAHWV